MFLGPLTNSYRPDLACSFSFPIDEERVDVAEHSLADGGGCFESTTPRQSPARHLSPGRVGAIDAIGSCDLTASLGRKSSVNAAAV